MVAMAVAGRRAMRVMGGAGGRWLRPVRFRF
jgi:hypothetical protein